jgi:hypothetical protein
MSTDVPPPPAMGRRRTGELVRAFLEDLGSNGPEVARRLADLGIRGVPNHQSECPLARLLSAAVGCDPVVARVRVSNSFVRLRKASGWPWVRVELPPAVTEFVAAFDAGRHPSLVQRSSPPSRADSTAT